jgi:hypothetical protein
MGNEQGKLLAIKLSVKLGEELRDPKYNVGNAYVRGFSQKALAKVLKKIPEFSQYEEETLAHASRYALIGNDDDRIGPVYNGSMSRAVYDEHSRRHRVESGKSSGLLGKKEKRGVHGLNRDELKECAIKGAISRGETPWTREEIAQVLQLSLLEIFKERNKIAYGPIAQALNDRFYQGKNVRTNVSVREALRRLERSFA